MAKTGYTWMLLYWKIKVIERPGWNTEVTVKTWPRKFEKVSSWRDFEVYDEKNNLIVFATTEWVLINIENMGIAKITEDMKEGYGLVNKSAFEEDVKAKLQEDDESNLAYEYKVRRSDIDSNGHVNNVVYVDLAYNAMPEDIALDFQNVEIYYKKQVKFGETVRVYYSEKDNTHTVCIKSEDDKNLHAILKFYN